MPVLGYKQLQDQLLALGRSPTRKALRAAASSAMLPALKAAKARAPVAEPPYFYPARGENPPRLVDPFPVRTYKGRLVTPGFAARNVARKTTVDREGTVVHAMLGVKPEAFYAVTFIELGTSRVVKQPWLEPSFRGSYSAVDSRFQEQLKKVLDRAVATAKDQSNTGEVSEE